MKIFRVDLDRYVLLTWVSIAIVIIIRKNKIAHNGDIGNFDTASG